MLLLVLASLYYFWHPCYCLSPFCCWRLSVVGKSLLFLAFLLLLVSLLLLTSVMFLLSLLLLLNVLVVSSCYCCWCPCWMLLSSLLSILAVLLLMTSMILRPIFRFFYQIVRHGSLTKLICDFGFKFLRYLLSKIDSPYHRYRELPSEFYIVIWRVVDSPYLWYGDWRVFDSAYRSYGESQLVI
jgi:hypothetical protein